MGCDDKCGASGKIREGEESKLAVVGGVRDKPSRGGGNGVPRMLAQENELAT